MEGTAYCIKHEPMTMTLSSLALLTLFGLCCMVTTSLTATWPGSLITSFAALGPWRVLVIVFLGTGSPLPVFVAVACGCHVVGWWRSFLWVFVVVCGQLKLFAVVGVACRGMGMVCGGGGGWELKIEANITVIHVARG